MHCLVWYLFAHDPDHLIGRCPGTPKNIEKSWNINVEKKVLLAKRASPSLTWLGGDWWRSSRTGFCTSLSCPTSIFPSKISLQYFYFQFHLSILSKYKDIDGGALVLAPAPASLALHLYFHLQYPYIISTFNFTSVFFQNIRILMEEL